MISIRKRREDLLVVELITLINKFGVFGALEVAKKVLDSLPMGLARIGNEAAQAGDSIGDIWTSGGGKVKKGANSTAIGH